MLSAGDHWPLVLPAVTLVLAGLAWRAWGRDPATGRSIKPEYAPPPGLTPAEAGALVDQRVDPREVIATVIDLAVRGVLAIEPAGRGDFAIRRLVAPGELGGLAPLERCILQRIFGEGLSLRERFLSELRRDQTYVFPPLRDAIYRAMVEGRLFPSSPFWVREGWTVAAVLLLLVGGVLLVEVGRLGRTGLAWPAGVAGSGLVLLAFSRVMPRRTPHGARLLVRVLGFQEFLVRAERDRLERLPADTLHRWLAWAIALNVTHEWIHRFEGLPVARPVWLAAGPFTLDDYERALERFGEQLAEAMEAGRTWIRGPGTAAVKRSDGEGSPPASRGG